MPHTLTLDILRQSPIAAELSDEQCEVLLGVLGLRALKDGEILIEEGKADNSLHGIYEGALAVSKDTGGGDWLVLHVLKSGHLAGELGFLDGEPHSATLRAVGGAKVFSLARDKFESLLHAHPDLVYRVMRGIAREIHAIVWRMNAQHVELSNYISKMHGRY